MSNKERESKAPKNGVWLNLKVGKTVIGWLTIFLKPEVKKYPYEFILTNHYHHELGQLTNEFVSLPSGLNKVVPRVQELFL